MVFLLEHIPRSVTKSNCTRMTQCKVFTLSQLHFNGLSSYVHHFVTKLKTISWDSNVVKL